MAIYVTSTLGGTGTWAKTYTDPATPVCCEVGTNMFSSKRADALEVGDRICNSSPPVAGQSVTIETVEEV